MKSKDRTILVGSGVDPSSTFVIIGDKMGEIGQKKPGTLIVENLEI